MTPGGGKGLRRAGALVTAKALVLLLGPATLGGEEVVPPGSILREDPRIDRLIPRDAKLERIADGFRWLEGPAWNRSEKALYFSDIPHNAVYRWREEGGASLFLSPSGYSGSEPFRGREPGANGLAFDPAGRLVLCEHGDRRVTRLEADGTRTVLVERHGGRRLNSPNDAVFGPDGALYFTDPPFGLPQTFRDPGRELDFSGVFRLDPGGALTLLTRDLKSPNGLAFSPDGKRLYLSDADPAHPAWWVYEVSGGALGRGRLFHDGTRWAARWKGSADGLKTDRAGNLFGAGPGGVHIFSPEGAHMGVIVTGVATSNCAWGDDGSTLFITAGPALYRIRLSTAGPGF